jgi:hypothetical protein
MTWQPLGAVKAQDLVPARLQLHWAAQVLAAAADAYVAPEPDDSHTALALEAGTLVCKAGVTLRIAELVIAVGKGALPLDGKTLADAMAWTDAQLSRSPHGMHARNYDMPAHPVGTSNARFARAPIANGLAELARYYANANELLRDHAPLAVWPHHFDLGGIIYIGERAQLGIGLSPGDASYAEPYLYVTPYPVRAGAALPALPSGGHWSSHFTGAVLTDLAGAGEASARAFVDAALAAGRALIAS